MPDTFTLIKNRTELRLGQLERAVAAEGSARPAWVIGILASVLIFTTVVDVLGNLLVIISVFRNRKLRNAELLRQESALLRLLTLELVTFKQPDLHLPVISAAQEATETHNAES
ncbi:Melatonin receptor type 1B-B [Takifugu flavidus]|uniref:Melatonin receptor type 1B-B n=1 Tax=Takifugu flavidus TaxID=433684 RepID=A0A5C6P7A7_9TELE|nr:Melatonin receptor type 1B-B [Takifugu flavidus]